jgi:glycosyltransferase involved in cell wall biosynthesis
VNILLMTPRLEIGGQDRHVADLAAHLAGRGHEVALWSAGGALERAAGHSRQRRVAFAELAPWPLWRRLPSAHIRDRLGWFRACLRETVTASRVQLVHCHGVVEATLSRMALDDAAVPLVFTGHGWPDGQWAWHARQVARCDHHIAVSGFSRDRLLEHGVDAARISRIPYGIRRLPLPDRAHVARLRARLQAGDPAALVVVTVARLSRQKGHDVLLRACARVLERVPRTVFVLVGDGPERTRLEQLASSLGVGAALRFEGARTDVAPYLASADVFCLPSRFEALPLAIPEAYQAGLPVVVSRVGGCAEIVDEDGTGLLVEPERPAALASALVALLGDERRRRRLGVRALAKADEPRFASDLVHGRIETLYDRLIERPPRRLPPTWRERALRAAAAG